MNYNIFMAHDHLVQSGQNVRYSHFEIVRSLLRSTPGKIVAGGLNPVAVVFLVCGTVLAVSDPGEAIHFALALLSAIVAAGAAHVHNQLTRFSEALEDELEERTSDLQVAYIELARLSQTKSDFVSIASHELRTPLSVLRGYSEMLLGDPKVKDNAGHLTLISGIHSGALRLGEVVTNLTDMARVDNQALQLHPESFSITQLIERVGHGFEQALSERNLTLKLETTDNLPVVEADPDTLRKAFSHLLSNAIKYTPDGGTITISGRAVYNGTENLSKGAIEIIFSDTGIGIDRRHHKQVFTKFFQVGDPALHSSGQTKFKGGGPGLGLAIARGIVETHKGKIWVESPGHDEQALPGSHFHVVLPLRQESEPVVGKI